MEADASKMNEIIQTNKIVITSNKNQEFNVLKGGQQEARIPAQIVLYIQKVLDKYIKQSYNHEGDQINLTFDAGNMRDMKFEHGYKPNAMNPRVLKEIQFARHAKSIDIIGELSPDIWIYS